MDNVRRLTELKSIDAYLDYQAGVVYPRFNVGQPDFRKPIYIKEENLPNDWYKKLSNDDAFSISMARVLSEDFDAHIGMIRYYKCK
jgi:hypothetical protein